MNLKFVIDYRTQWGQNIYLELDGNEIKMDPTSGDQWEVEAPVNKDDEITYRYFILDENSGWKGYEFGEYRRLSVSDYFDSALIRDYWRAHDAHENPLYTSPFSKAFFKREETSPQVITYDKKFSYIRLQIRAPRIGQDYQMGIVGSSSSLGNWNEEKAVLMSDEDFPVWKVDIPIQPDEVPFEYKYVIYSHKEKRVVTWEGGANCYFSLYDFSKKNKLIIYTDETFNYPVGNWKCAGVAIPVFSLRSENSSGVGEFTDIKLMVDWSIKTGMKIVQVLPVNDTVATHSWTDSYPYAAISVDALHPIYADLAAIGPLKDQKAKAKIAAERKRLNYLQEIDYEAVMALKSKFFKLSYEENKTQFLKSKEFKSFLKANEHWMYDYAVFSCLRDRYKTPDFSQWGKHASMTDKEIADFVSPKQSHYDDVAVHYYIQYHLDKQLKEASDYARNQGVVLKGDIPIGIYRYSVEAWRVPHLFNMDCQSGAPPDDFSITGQNWGFPTYNWEEMAKDGFEWWKDRLVKMADYFDVFRIDHILGFFRIWEIPMDAVEGLLGRFNPALPFHVDEFGQRGTYFDFDRFCKPYIRTHMIHDIFGNHAEMVFREFLQEYSDGCWEFVEGFDTQRKVKDHFDQKIKVEPESKEFNNWLRFNLYRLHSEVLFLEAPFSDRLYFNPRIGFHSTYSFSELDDHTKQRLDEMYIHYFYKRHNEFWRSSAMQKLPVLKSATDMLICGEDLGMVPSSVPGVMNELQILSLAIQRMPNDDREFWHPADTPYMSVTSTGSHDMSTLREWWQEDLDQTQRFFNSILGQDGQAPYFCEPWVATDVINQHVHSPSMLAIFPLQDLLAMDGKLRRDVPEEERINVPANPQHYWRYRMHISLEDMLKEEGFNGFLRQLMDQGGRTADY